MQRVGRGFGNNENSARRIRFHCTQTASRNPDLTPIARSKSTSQIHQHGQAESSLDQLSFEFLDPAAFERVREQGGLAGVARRVVRRQNTATGTTRG